MPITDTPIPNHKNGLYKTNNKYWRDNDINPQTEEEVTDSALTKRHTYWLKLISGYVTYSDCFCFVFLRGNVQKNAFANNDAICC